MTHRDPFEPQLLAHHAGAAPGARTEGELDFTQRLAGLHLVPQPRPVG